MVNNRDEKFEGHEESEYHFSDDDMSYEVENEGETPKSPPTPIEAKEGIVARLSRSKRMLISLAVFLVLIFVVYKMISPTVTSSSTEITPPVAQQQPAKSISHVMPAEAAVKPTPEQLAALQNAPAVTPAAQHLTQVQHLPQQAVSPVPQQEAQQTVLPSHPERAAQQPMPEQMMPSAPQQPVAQVPSRQMIQPIQQATMQRPMPAQQQVMAQPQQTMPSVQGQQPTAMPAQQQAFPQQNQFPTQGQVMVAPEQSVQQPYPLNQSQVVQQPMSTEGFAMPVQNESELAQLNAKSNQLMAQLQNQYVQRLNEFSAQNKNLEEKVTALNARVVNMEGQLNQLIQILTHQVRASRTPAPQPAPRPQHIEPMHTSYNVQAIIPGRAWLKSENGDTVTVAEGDMIRNLGRVTRIDPYDGIVEVNTGNRIISLSYGNGS